MAEFDQGKTAILDRWRSYWEGGKTLMACQGCPGGGGNRYPKPPSVGGGGTPAAASSPGRAPDGYRTVEFHGQSTGTREYKGQSTGTRYRFGNNPGHRRKFVYEADVPGLQAFKEGGHPMFTIVNEDIGPLAAEPPLEAVGPPLRPETPQQPVRDAPMAHPNAPPLAMEETPQTRPAPRAAATAPPEPSPAPTPPVAEEDDPPPRPTGPRTVTVKELRDKVKVGLGVEELAALLGKERVGPNRPSAVTMLEAALRKAQGR